MGSVSLLDVEKTIFLSVLGMKYEVISSGWFDAGIRMYFLVYSREVLSG